MPQCGQDAVRAQTHISQPYAKCMYTGLKNKCIPLTIHSLETQFSSSVHLITKMHVVLRLTK